MAIAIPGDTSGRPTSGDIANMHQALSDLAAKTAADRAAADTAYSRATSWWNVVAIDDDTAKDIQHSAELSESYYATMKDKMDRIEAMGTHNDAYDFVASIRNALGQRALQEEAVITSPVNMVTTVASETGHDIVTAAEEVGERAVGIAKYGAIILVVAAIGVGLILYKQGFPKVKVSA